MKKGLTLALGTMILAFASGKGYANAPVINAVPDVVISDTEDNATVGATVDLNFFRYLNAFNIMSYTTDSDSSPESLVFAFKEEEGSTNGDLSINGKLELTDTEAQGTSLAAWPSAKQIHGKTDGYWFSFRNIIWSPTVGNKDINGVVRSADPTPGATDNSTSFPAPKLADGSSTVKSQDVMLPWRTSTGSFAGDKRTVDIFVTDDTDKQDSDVINVYCRNAGADQLSGTFTTIWSDHSFAAAAWTFSAIGSTAIPAATSSNTAGVGTGFVGLGAPAGTTGKAYYGQWATLGSGTNHWVYTIDKNTDSSKIYAAKVSLKAEGTLKSLMPDIRLGVQQVAQTFYTEHSVWSNKIISTSDSENPQIPNVSTGEVRNYNLFWSANSDSPEYANLSNFFGTGIDGRRWQFFFETINSFNGDTGDAGTWKLMGIDIGLIDKPAAATGTSLIAMNVTTAGGFYGEPVGTFTNGTLHASVAQNTPSAGKVQFQALAGATGNASYPPFALWRKDNAVPWQAGKLLRASLKLSCPTDTDRANMNWVRVRHQTALWLYDEFHIRQATAGAYTGHPTMPALASAGGTTYEVYVPSFGGPNQYIIDTYGPLNLKTDPSHFLTAIDYIGAGQADGATKVTLESLQYEVLSEPVLP